MVRGRSGQDFMRFGRRGMRDAALSPVDRVAQLSWFSWVPPVRRTCSEDATVRKFVSLVMILVLAGCSADETRESNSESKPAPATTVAVDDAAPSFMTNDPIEKAKELINTE